MQVLAVGGLFVIWQKQHYFDSAIRGKTANFNWRYFTILHKAGSNVPMYACESVLLVLAALLTTVSCGKQ